MKRLVDIIIMLIIVLIIFIAVSFTRVESRHYQDRIEYYTIDSISNPYKVPLVLKRNKIYLPCKY